MLRKSTILSDETDVARCWLAYAEVEMVQRNRSPNALSFVDPSVTLGLLVRLGKLAG